MISKGILIWINWIIFVLLVLCTTTMISLVVGAFYHPNAPSSPYSQPITNIWFLSLVTSFIWSIILLLIKKHASVKTILFSSISIYGVLIVIGLILISLVKPVPKYFTHMVGEQKYHVPSTFTMIQDNEHGVNIHMCIETLTGLYENGNCDYQNLTLSVNPIYKNNTLKIDIFNQKANEFEIDKNDRVNLLEGSQKYLIGNVEGIRAYSYYYDREKEALDDLSGITDLVAHLQIDDQDKLLRFVECRVYQGKFITKYFCYHSVKTSQGILNYETKYSNDLNLTDFNQEKWQETDKKILDLISQWKVD